MRGVFIFVHPGDEKTKGQLLGLLEHTDLRYEIFETPEANEGVPILIAAGDRYDGLAYIGQFIASRAEKNANPDS